MALRYHVVQARSAIETPSPTTPPLPPLKEQLQYYSLPIGALGFITHFITFYIAVMLIVQRSPLGLGLNRYKVLNSILSAISGLLTIGICVWNLHSCGENVEENIWVMGAWEFLLSLFFGGLGLHAATWNQWREKEDTTGIETATERRVASSDDENLDGDDHQESEEHKLLGTPSNDSEKVENIHDGKESELPDIELNDTASERTAVEQEAHVQQEVHTEGVTGSEAESKPKTESKSTSMAVLIWVAGFCTLSIITFPYLIRLILNSVGTHHSIEQISLVFITFIVTIFVFSMMILVAGNAQTETENGLVLVLIIFISIIWFIMAIIGTAGPLWADWILAALAENWGGVALGGKNTALCWLFVIARALPLFSR